MKRRIRSQILQSTLYRSSQLLTLSDRRKVFAVIVLQIIFGLLDLIGVGLIGVLGAIAISGVGARDTGNRVGQLLELLGLDNFPLQTQALILGTSAALLLVGKTIFSIYFTKRTIFFLSRRGAQISTNLLSKLFSKSLLTINSQSGNQLVYSVTGGVNSVVVGVMGNFVTIVSDLSLLLVLTIGLFAVDPMVAGSSLLLFSSIGFILYSLMHKNAESLGTNQSILQISSNEKIFEIINAYREVVVKNRRNYYAREIGAQRLQLADISAELSFLPNISKYTVEIAVVVGALLISVFQFLRFDASHAAAVLGIFMAASTRIAPAVLRIQQGAVSIKSAIGIANPTLKLIDDLEKNSTTHLWNSSVQPLDTSHIGFKPRVRVDQVSFKYPNKEVAALSNISFEVVEGETLGIVGTSGAGKTTLIDVMLGILPIEQGFISISGLIPGRAIEEWPGAISYVPQDVMISNGTIRSNVSMGFSPDEFNDDLIWQALRLASLEDFVASLPDGLNQIVGDRGSQLSGGQRQRLGIARAMFTKPKLIVLDEATSSLDSQTELDFSDSINAIKGEVTIVIVAHRLSTIRECDNVIYMKQGEIRAKGSFDHVRNSVPEFNEQAKLMGL